VSGEIRAREVIVIKVLPAPRRLPRLQNNNKSDNKPLPGPSVGAVLRAQKPPLDKGEPSE
jgi:hypothetical protein